MCETAHGHQDIPDEAAADRVLVAVFASPVAAALLRFAAECGFRPVLVEPNPDAGPAEDLPTGTIRVGSVRDLDETLVAHADVVVCDHHRADLGSPLRDALDMRSRWVGIMGSPRHTGPHVEALAALGVPPEEVAKVHRPIGLDIGSRTPAEIAVSTLAGLLADRNGREGGAYRG